MSRSNESSVTSIPSEAIQKVFISNYQDVVEDITDLVYGFSIYEHLMKPTSSCEILLADAKGTIVPTGKILAVVGATPDSIILGTNQDKFPDASDPKKVSLEGPTPGKS